MDWSMQLWVLYEVGLAMVLGAVIGIEREMADKPAGFRTHMLVAGAAALLVGLRDVMIYTPKEDAAVNVTSDPIRIIEAIITGVSFIGAGTIFRRSRSEQVHGLTTAASLLLSTSVGICVALSQKLLAVGVTILALIILRGLTPLERKLSGSNNSEQ